MCDRLLTEIIHSCVMGLRFLFYNDSTYCILNLLIVQWFTVKIIAICYGYLQFCIVFVSWSSHTRSFVPCATLVQDMFSTFEYVKIAHLIDYWIIRKWRFLIICLMLCVFFLVFVLWTHSDSLSSIKLSLTMMPFDSSSYVEQTCENVFSTRKSYDSLLSVEQSCKIRIWFVPFISILTG